MLIIYLTSDCLIFISTLNIHDIPIKLNSELGRSHLALSDKENILNRTNGSCFKKCCESRMRDCYDNQEDVPGARSDADVLQHGHRFDSRISRISSGCMKLARYC